MSSWERLWKRQRSQRATRFAVACFNRVCGIQLTMLWETEALIGRAVA
jgi:hypothetical protein